MRILYSHRIQSRDGQGVHLDAMVDALRAAGHQVLVVGPAGYARTTFGAGGGGTARLRRFLPRAAMELAELLYNIPAWLRLVRAARRFRPQAVYERANLFYVAGALLARWRRIPFLLEVNAPLAEERGTHGGLRLRGLAAATERFVWRGADTVFPVTGVLAGHVAAAGVPPQRITVIQNGIDLGHYPPSAPGLAGQGRPLVLGFVGFVRAWHGLDAVIRALAAARTTLPLRLTVVGDGPARPELERLVVSLGVVDQVHFVGLAAREAVPTLVAGFDIALQPAVVPYASPLKLFEYMAAGRAIVAPNQPNVREILAHDRTALLFDPAEGATALWRAVEHLAADPALRARLGAAARAEIERRDLTWTANAGRVVCAIESALTRRDTRRGDLGDRSGPARQPVSQPPA